MFAIKRFRCIEVLLHTFYYCWGEKCRSFLTEDFVIKRFVKSRSLSINLLVYSTAAFQFTLRMYTADVYSSHRYDKVTTSTHGGPIFKSWAGELAPK